MTSNRRSTLVISIATIGIMLLSACTQSLSNAPVETPTLIPTGLFVSPIASVENPMEMIEQFARQTEAAQTAAAGGGTPAEASATPDPNATASGATPTITPTATTNAATPTNANPAAPTAIPAATLVPGTPVPPGVRPPSYTLQKGEWPWCIARRFNVDPYAMLQASGLTVAQAEILAAGTVLTIPQGAGAFPGPRTLKTHPASYTVASGNDTVHGIACQFGDVDPNAIASANSISVSAALTAGQILQIP